MSATSAHDRGSVTDQLVLRVDPLPTSCGQVRHAVRSFCLTHSLAHVADDAELLASEIMTNAIRHAHALITVVAICADEQILVNVHDDDTSQGSPMATTVADEAESGRGLLLVDQIAGKWGTTRHPDGKSVWFRLP